MIKQCMARSGRTHTQPKNGIPSVPKLQGKAKNNSQPATPIVGGTSGSEQKLLHSERPISKAYPAIDNDLAWDNLENDLPVADLQDL